MSKGFYDAHPILHNLPKYQPFTTSLEIGDGSHLAVAFIIPLIVNLGEHTFEIFTLVNNSTKNKLLLGMKNLVKIEGIICTRSLRVKFLNRSASLFLTTDVLIPPGKKCTVRFNVHFPNEMSGIAIVHLI